MYRVSDMEGGVFFGKHLLTCLILCGFRGSFVVPDSLRIDLRFISIPKCCGTIRGP